MTVRMAYLRVTLLLLVTVGFKVEALNIPNLEGNPVEDIVTFLDNVKTHVINFISTGFTLSKKVKSPSQSQPLHLPHPPIHVPQPIQPPSSYVPHPPNLPHGVFMKKRKPYQHLNISTHNENTSHEPFPITDINIPSEVQHVEKPAEAAKGNDVEHANSSFANIEHTTLGSDNKENDLKVISSLKNVENAGPESFVDNKRVNAGIRVETIANENIIKNIPKDLWREDLASGEKHFNHHGKKVKKVRRLKSNVVETSTPSDPELVIE